MEPKTRQPVRVKLGQRVIVDAGRGAQIEVYRETSGAVTIRNLVSGTILRQWSPKEAKNP